MLQAAGHPQFISTLGPSSPTQVPYVTSTSSDANLLPPSNVQFPTPPVQNQQQYGNTGRQLTIPTHINSRLVYEQ